MHENEWRLFDEKCVLTCRHKPQKAEGCFVDLRWGTSLGIPEGLMLIAEGLGGLEGPKVAPVWVWRGFGRSPQKRRFVFAEH